MPDSSRQAQLVAAVIAVTLGAPIPQDLWLPCHRERDDFEDEYEWIPLAEYLADRTWLCYASNHCDLHLQAFYDALERIDPHSS